MFLTGTFLRKLHTQKLASGWLIRFRCIMMTRAGSAAKCLNILFDFHGCRIQIRQLFFLRRICFANWQVTILLPAPWRGGRKSKPILITNFGGWYGCRLSLPLNGSIFLWYSYNSKAHDENSPNRRSVYKFINCLPAADMLCKISHASTLYFTHPEKST